jgi:O-succinylbenzoic acid--CoA ligase
MNSPTLQLGNKTYSLGNLPKLSQTLTFDERTIDFCQRWLSGQQQFEIHSSGSTGQPKKILISRQSMIASANGTIQALGLQANQTSLVCLDTAYIAGMMMLVRSLEIGMNIIAVEPCANPFEKIKGQDQIHFAALVPYQVKAILDSPQNIFFSQFETVIIGGAPLDQFTKIQLQNFPCQFYETFGMTETISHIALKKINGKNKSDYFELLPNITIRQDERACLCIKTPYLPDEIITNDVVELKNLQEFMWLGRFDNVINSGGIKIFPESTEKKIELVFSLENIKNRFFITGLPDERLGQAVTLIVEGSITPDQEGKTKQMLREKLAKFEQPRSMLLVEKFDETKNGKINRNETRARLIKS